ncbi:PAS/PAC sensor signal transduction histidine kinase [Halanaeroarchaeum sulfurireducens]|uniref:PAS/PAC sensor signal transduction histidine kinase n=1 Tax=Halanaeroarchaeum sulfurireducens TaxID=1604004 RepID=A0A0F7P7V9_9EURY|nr:PAS/PAC sensor signal transduction histidine kinase [Halanaeroarchaeum sulfurireducens]
MDGTSSQTSRSVLHVSADPPHADAFAREIEELTDFTVISTDSVGDALATLDTRADVECIVSDYDVPDIDGLAFLQSVRAQYPDIPFILFTSEGNETVASKAITVRVTDYLIKERFQDQWAQLAELIEESITYHRSQRSLADPKSRAKVIFETVPDPLAVVQDGTLCYANGTALDLFEIESLETLSGRSVIDHIATDFRDTATSSLDAIQAEERRVDRFELTVVGREGANTPVELTAVAIRWSGSRAILLILRDISERKEAQLGLRRFKQAAEAAGHAVYITDAEGTIEYVNPAFESTTGYTAEEAMGKTPSIMKSGEMSTDYYADLWDTILAGDVWEEELINRRKDGELYHAHQTIAPITDHEGEIQSFVAIQTDISERVRRRQEAQRQKRRYESLFNNIRDAILVADTDRRIVDCNEAFTDLFGYDLDEIEGDQTKYVYESEEAYEEMGEALAGHANDPQFTTLVEYEKQSGQVFPGETSVSYRRDSDDNVTGYIALIRDVSGRNERIAQLRIIDTVLRHNLHNDLNVIEGNASLIADDTTGKVETRAQKIIDTSGKLLKTTDKQRLITDLLAEAPTPEPIDIASRLDTTVSSIRDSHPAADISLDAPDTCEIRAVPELVQGIKELIENAIEHSDRDQPTVEVTIERQDGTVTVTVADDGPGIPEMERQVLTRTEDIEPLYHGSGMGLWFVTLVVRRSDGVLEFHENEPRGSVVTIRLPYD